jgi:large subunit ribosomal protein L24
MRLANTLAQGEGADLTMAGNVDLVEGSLSSRLTLAGPGGAPASAAQRPLVFVSLKGSLGSPKRSLDLSALTAWLTLRAIEQQSKNLEAIEAGRRRPMAPTANASTVVEDPKSVRAPPLPAPIDIGAPRAAERKPARNPAQIKGGATIPRTAPAKPLLSAPPPSRMPLDLSARPN